MANVGQLLSNAFLTAYQAETTRRQREREMAEQNRQFTELMDYRNRSLASDIGYKEADIDYKNRKLASDIDYQTKTFEAETDYQSGMLAENRLERERRTDVDQADFASKYIQVPEGTAGAIGGNLIRARAGKIAGDLDPNAYYMPISLGDGQETRSTGAGADVSGFISKIDKNIANDLRNEDIDYGELAGDLSGLAAKSNLEREYQDLLLEARRAKAKGGILNEAKLLAGIVSASDGDLTPDEEQTLRTMIKGLNIIIKKAPHTIKSFDWK